MTTETANLVARWTVAPIDAGATSELDERQDVDGERDQLWAAVDLPVTPTRPATVSPRITRPAPRDDRFVWVGAHDGAGETSLAKATGLGLPLTRQWPLRAIGWPGDVVIVARATSEGLSAASTLMREVLSGAIDDVRLLALVVVADRRRGGPGRDVQVRLHELEAVAPTIIRVPWIRLWEHVPGAPRPITQQLARQLIDLQAHSG
ncbi:DUF6668 family protein [Nocardioides alkalitolerans]|uniref:DUF6668 family protein n=1 Tax=Nocardioides alkalitolerans TaxID=281714 RepID=UPI0006941F01|nr:DUF6668 family protein [Nocardioides alkalitolerans]